MSTKSSDEWMPPIGYNFQSNTEYEQFIFDTKPTQVVDPIEYVADDLFELQFPDQLQNHIARGAYVADIVARGVEYGTWFHFNDTDTLVRFAPADDHFRLRTGRNRNLITLEEQRTIYQTRIAAFGLSVGSRAVESMVQSGIGNDYMLFDPDRISVANLNRLNAPFESVGDLKTVEAGRKISHIDPYITQSLHSEGYAEGTDDFLRRLRPDIIVEEMDDMAAKAKVRRIAAELHIPIVMAGDVHDKTVLSVERHDLEATPLFNGSLSQSEIDKLKSDTMSENEQQTALIKIIGMRNISLRMLDSAPRIGVELAGMPQLGTTATVGGAIVADTVRDILLHRNVRSGRRVLNINDISGGGVKMGILERLKVIRNFIQYRAKSMDAK